MTCGVFGEEFGEITSRKTSTLNGKSSSVQNSESVSRHSCDENMIVV